MERLPDFRRLGGLDWARRTKGSLTAAERRRLLGEIAKGQAQNLIGRAKLALGRLPARAHSVDAGSFQPPDSRLCREAEEACSEQPAEIAGHSYRTWMFGLALAAVDGIALDPELFYCGSLVHDWGIADPTPGRDFTIASGDRAIACAEAAGVPHERAERVADAISVHTTPGASPERDGALGCYIQWGAMADGGGLRLWDISPESRRNILAKHPREPGFKRVFADTIRAEAKAVPGGRFDLLVKCGLTLAVRMAPFDD